VAQRRRQLINDAFSNFITSLHLAGVNRELLPPVLDELIYGFEYFLLTDVVVDHDRGKEPQDAKDISVSIRPKSIRRRASRVDRDKELDDLRASTKKLVIDDEPHDLTVNGTKTNTSVLDSKLLPEDPVTFSILVAVGAVARYLCADNPIICHYWISHGSKSLCPQQRHHGEENLKSSS
jgi:hypothetical protein